MLRIRRQAADAVDFRISFAIHLHKDPLLDATQSRSPFKVFDLEISVNFKMRRFKINVAISSDSGEVL